jgi:hypothetical protein
MQGQLAPELLQRLLDRVRNRTMNLVGIFRSVLLQYLKNESTVGRR